MLNIPQDIIFKFSPQIILVIDQEGEVVKLNPTAQRKVKKEPDSLKDFGIELSVSEIGKLIKQSSECQIKTKIGVKYYNFFVQGCAESKCCYFFGDDTTALVLRKKELKKQQDFLRKVIDSDPSLIFVKDIEGRFLLGNKALAKVYGSTTKDIIGKTDADFNPYIEELEHFNEDDSYVITHQKSLYVQEEMVTTAAGEQLWLETVKVPLVMSDGVVNVLGIAQNINQRKKLQNKLIQAQKIEAIGKLAGGVAHDFNNLLTAIISSSELITLDIDYKDRVLNHANVIEKTAGQATRLSRKLLTFSQQNNRDLDLIYFHKVIEESLVVFERITGKKIIITSNLQAGKSTFNGDLVEIQQLILNLIINAGDALSEDQENKIINITTNNVSVDLRKSKKLSIEMGEYLKLEIEDNGCGMSVEQIAHIFEPFYSTKKEQNGTGLGLAVVYGVVEAHSGAIFVDSDVGVGTKFKIYLPLSSKEDTPTIELSKPQIQDHSKTILLVDDYPFILEVTSKMLEKIGYNLITAANTTEAVKIYQQNKEQIDFIILDIITPGISAKDCFVQLQAINPEVKVLLASGYAEKKDVKDILASGAIGFIQKPYQMEDLARSLSY